MHLVLILALAVTLFGFLKDEVNSEEVQCVPPLAKTKKSKSAVKPENSEDEEEETQAGSESFELSELNDETQFYEPYRLVSVVKRLTDKLRPNILDSDSESEQKESSLVKTTWSKTQTFAGALTGININGKYLERDGSKLNFTKGNGGKVAFWIEVVNGVVTDFKGLKDITADKPIENYLPSDCKFLRKGLKVGSYPAEPKEKYGVVFYTDSGEKVVGAFFISHGGRFVSPIPECLKRNPYVE